MNVLIAGATGATGRLLTKELLGRGCTVKAIVRRKDSLPEDLLKHPNLILKEAPLLDLRDGDLEEIVWGCDAIASCLGHTISFRGIYGPPTGW